MNVKKFVLKTITSQLSINCSDMDFLKTIKRINP